jgi:hypothetical protein
VHVHQPHADVLRGEAPVGGHDDADCGAVEEGELGQVEDDLAARICSLDQQQAQPRAAREVEIAPHAEMGDRPIRGEAKIHSTPPPGAGRLGRPTATPRSQHEADLAYRKATSPFSPEWPRPDRLRIRDWWHWRAAAPSAECPL